MSRKSFLNEFLGALGAVEIEWQEETESFISGCVFYDVNDLSEKQTFRWTIAESDAPVAAVERLAALIKSCSLLNGDRIISQREKLLTQFNEAYNETLSMDQFLPTFESLVNIRVSMLDNGLPSDFYFIHE